MSLTDTASGKYPLFRRVQKLFEVLVSEDLLGEVGPGAKYGPSDSQRRGLSQRNPGGFEIVSDVPDQVLLGCQPCGVDGVRKGEAVNVAMTFYDSAV